MSLGLRKGSTERSSYRTASGSERDYAEVRAADDPKIAQQFTDREAVHIENEAREEMDASLRSSSRIRRRLTSVRQSQSFP